MKKKIILLMTFIFLLPCIVKANERVEVKFKSCVDGDTANFVMNNKTIKVRFLAINTPEIKQTVTRSLEDFEFFHNVLVERYPFKYTPPIFPRNKDKTYSHELYKRYLNRFLEHVAQRKILRTSPITLEFLELNTEQWDIYRKKLEANKFVCKYNMENIP